jgi:hypothetical protein
LAAGIPAAGTQLRDGRVFFPSRQPLEKQTWESTMNSIALRLAILAVGASGAMAVNERDAQNKAPGAYAVLDFSAVNSPDVFKILPSKTGDLDGHTA